jgi:hypothetical protein
MLGESACLTVASPGPPRRQNTAGYSNKNSRHIFRHTVASEIQARPENQSGQCQSRHASFGFAAVPSAAGKMRLKDETFVRLDPAYPLVWLRGDKETIICSANGHSFSVSANPAVVRLFKCLNRGGQHRVSDLLDRYAGIEQAADRIFEATRKDIHHILTKLAGLRAINSVAIAPTIKTTR